MPARLLATRRAVVSGWNRLSEQLRRQGKEDLARDVQTFVSQMPPALTDNELLRASLGNDPKRSSSRAPAERRR